MRLLGFLAVLVVLCSGCNNAKKLGFISGSVTDVNGNPFVGAQVRAQGGGTIAATTTQTGAYVLTDVPEGFTRIIAEAIVGGVRFFGQQVAQVFQNEQTKSVNIMMAPENQLGDIEGRVLAPNGSPIRGARVFVGGALASAMDVTDNDGRFSIRDLPAGFSYPVVASAPDFENDRRDDVLVTANQVSTLSFLLNFSSNRPVFMPEGLFATAYTLPQIPEARSNRHVRAYDAIKGWLDPDRPKATLKGRAVGGHFVEVDLGWDFEDNRSMLGFGVFRGTNATGPLNNAIAFLRDPLASYYADLDGALQPETSYFYEIVALNTDYLDEPTPDGSESPRSDRVSARPFLSIDILSPQPNAITSTTPVISWQSVPRADAYQIIVYNRFPDYDVDPYYPIDPDSPGESRVPAPLTSFVYPGNPPLIPGRTYFAVVIALTNDGSTRSFSQIVPFEVR
ncbi:MAG: carboxypeptidase regulatory-like domain-containing protein [Armatimonadetes bacterium]|nr:carboxypeptidase regulatory-like domain-containing protein [Armatimonadota bacterium]